MKQKVFLVRTHGGPQWIMVMVEYRLLEFCQAQFKFSTSSVQFEPTHTPPPGKVEIQQLLDYLGH